MKIGNLTRYNIQIYWEDGDTAGLEEYKAKEGPWVKYEDVVLLNNENDKLKDKLKQLEQRLRDAGVNKKVRAKFTPKTRIVMTTPFWAVAFKNFLHGQGYDAYTCGRENRTVQTSFPSPQVAKIIKDFAWAGVISKLPRDLKQNDH